MQPTARRWSLRPAIGFELIEEELLAQRFADEVMAPLTQANIAQIPGHLDLLEPTQRAQLLTIWQALAGDKWVPGWLKSAL